jgi:hypothetical protein
MLRAFFFGFFCLMAFDKDPVRTTRTDLLHDDASGFSGVVRKRAV